MKHTPIGSPNDRGMPQSSITCHGATCAPIDTLVSRLLDLAGEDRDIGCYPLDSIRYGYLATQSAVSLIHSCADSVDDTLSKATGGALRVSQRLPVGPVTLRWLSSSDALSYALPGLELAVQLGMPDVVTLEVMQPSKTEVLAEINGQPWFVRVRGGRSLVYVIGSPPPCPDTFIGSADHELAAVSVVVALLTYTRSHFPALAWFSGEPMANFVIDDPLLQPRYGFVNYARLVEALHELQTAATIAVIPWNGRRSAPSTVSLCRTTKHLSLGVHGFQHLDDEFASGDVDTLASRSVKALSYMRLHRRVTGLPFEPVMVFPKGRFSSQALHALDDVGFLAATNSTFLAADIVAGTTRLAHLLQPAITTYGGVPLFRRRGVGAVKLLRYDLILGRPLLLVAHHDFFRDRGALFASVMAEVNQICPQIKWRPLGRIATGSHLIRRSRSGTSEIKFYGRRLKLSQPSVLGAQLINSALRRDVNAVSVNGTQVPFTFDKGVVTSHTGPYSTLDVTLTRRPFRVSRATPGDTCARNLQADLRGYLVALRDNSLHVLPPWRL